MEWLFAETHRRMRWKNGRGETVEIAVEPREASIDTFDWRVSTAAVVEDGVFSTFQGIERTLAVLNGGELFLTIGEQPESRLDTASVPLSFPADTRCVARLSGEAVEDLNVMSRRGVCRHLLKRLSIDVTIEQTSTVAVIVSAPGAATVQVDGSQLEFRPLDSLRLSSGHRITLISGNAWLAQFDPVGA
jgi:environmental stress-induced protein Ves